MTTNRCRAPGCGRFAATGADYCRRHEDRSTDDTRAGAREALRLAFLERLEKGEYAALFETNLSQVIAQAAKAMKERGPDDEIGALRFVMARLLAEEDDPAKLASGVTRVVTAAIQAARTQRTIGGETAEGLTSALTHILAELDEG
jgi:hypothetical protein